MVPSRKYQIGPAALLLAATSIWPTAAVAEVVVPVPSPYSYDTATLRQLDLRGIRGRYIGFIG